MSTTAGTGNATSPAGFRRVDPMSEMDVISLTLAALFLLLACVPAVQLVRVRVRVPSLGWTTQKLFFVLILVSLVARFAFFVVVPWVHGDFFELNFASYPLFVVLDTLPSVLFFSTFTLLVLFWAEIIHHARNQSMAFPQRLRPAFMVVNAIAYFAVFTLWALLFLWDSQQEVLDIAVNAVLAAIYIVAIAGFLYFGGRLFLMLRQYPIESTGRRAKLREVGWVTAVVSSCYAVRVALLVFVSINKRVDTSPIFIGVFYFLVEVVPSALVLFVLRKLPPPSRSQPIASPIRARASRYSATSEERQSIMRMP